MHLKFQNGYSKKCLPHNYSREIPLLHVIQKIFIKSWFQSEKYNTTTQQSRAPQFPVTTQNEIKMLSKIRIQGFLSLIKL